MDGDIDGGAGACEERAGHIDSARFRHGLFSHNRIGGQELLVDFFTTVHPCPLALVLDDFLLAAAGDGINVPGGVHGAAHIHRPLVGGDIVIHRGRRNRNGGIVIDARLEVGVQI